MSSIGEYKKDIAIIYQLRKVFTILHDNMKMEHKELLSKLYLKTRFRAFKNVVKGKLEAKQRKKEKKIAAGIDKVIKMDEIL